MGLHSMRGLRAVIGPLCVGLALDFAVIMPWDGGLPLVGLRQISGIYGWSGMAVDFTLRCRGQPMILSAIAEKLKRLSKDDFKGRHFEVSLILQAVCWYSVLSLSLALQVRAADRR